MKKWVIKATFILVDVQTHYTLFRRDWMLLLGLYVATVIMEATKIHNMREETVEWSPEQLLKVHMEVFKVYSEVFKDQLGILQGIETLVSVEPHQYKVSTTQTSIIC